MLRKLTILAGLLALFCPPARGDSPKFDSSRYMRVSEVRPGMKGYGLSVFDGTNIQRFDVEVVSVLKNFNPKCDVVLIRCHGANLEHTGPIAGMSGSPIFLRDDAGHDRMIGAFAYGWPLQKDPIAGVQPIEYMLQASAATQPSRPAQWQTVWEANQPAPVRQARWSLDETVLLPGMKTPPENYPLAEWGKFTPNPKLLAAGSDQTRMQPLATPLMTAGIPPSVLSEIEPVFRAYGLIPLQAGGGGTAAEETPAKIEPGSVLALPLLEGDVDMSAVGTCTERMGNRIVAFGHPFLNEGITLLPLSGGSIQGIVANWMTSFKLGSPAQISGALVEDDAVGVVGEIGRQAPLVPIDIRVQYADGKEDQTYHFDCAVHPKLTPLLVAAALASAVTGAKDLPQYHTLDYNLTIDFANGKSIHIDNSDVDATVADLFFEIGTPLIGASDNPFEQVMVKKVEGSVLVTPEARSADILYAVVPRSRYRPGETVKAYVTYRPFRSGEMVLPVTLELPRDLPDGDYQLTISDWQKYLDDERTAEPFKFTAENIDEVFDVLRDVSAVSHKAVFVRLLRQPDGVAIGHTAMPRLPSSRRQIMMDSGRSDTTEFVSSALQVVATPRVMSGSCDFQITIDRNANTDLNAPTRPPHREIRPAPAKANAAEAAPKPGADGDNP